MILLPPAARPRCVLERIVMVTDAVPGMVVARSARG